MSDFTFHLSEASWWLRRAKTALEEYKVNPDVHKKINTMHLISIAEADVMSAQKDLEQ